MEDFYEDLCYLNAGLVNFFANEIKLTNETCVRCDRNQSLEYRTVNIKWSMPPVIAPLFCFLPVLCARQRRQRMGMAMKRTQSYSQNAWPLFVRSSSPVAEAVLLMQLQDQNYKRGKWPGLTWSIQKLWQNWRGSVAVLYLCTVSFVRNGTGLPAYPWADFTTRLFCWFFACIVHIS